jgi:SAM-dependent methyltransferase
MDIAAYAVEALVQEDHWWFVGRRQLFSRELARLSLDRRAVTFDTGTSTGTNLRMLRDFGFCNVTGLDLSDEAIRFCTEKGLGHVKKGDVNALPFADETFELCLATDIIEHVDDDIGALRELNRALKPGGHLLITVPAFASLWGLQDKVSHHKRRYHLRELKAKAETAGFTVERRYYFNFILFAPIFLARQIIRIAGLEDRLKSENEVYSPFINRILLPIFALDARLAPMLRLPFGVSILMLAKKGAARTVSR